MFRQSGADFFDPDEAARRILDDEPDLGRDRAGSLAWHEGKRLLERSIAERLTFAFETTLGGRTISGILERALDSTMRVRVWYIGLEGVELHIARVRARIQKGGHPIPEPRIRERYDSSRANLIRLLPRLTELRLYDNSQDGDPGSGATPEPVLILHMILGRIKYQCDLEKTPSWAKPIVAAAMRMPGKKRP